MTRLFLGVLGFLVGLNNGLASQPAARPDPILSSMLLTTTDKNQLSELGQRFEIIRNPAGGFQVIVPTGREAEVLTRDPGARVVESNLTAEVEAKLKSYRSLFSAGAKYHSLAEINKWIQTKVAEHPQLTTAIQYGTSPRGNGFMALSVGRGVSQPSNPGAEIMLTAATHGDELITSEVLMHLANELLTGYGSNPRLTKILDTRTIHIIPVVNPDGFTARQRWDNGADPNRSYPYPGHETKIPTPSIQAVIAFVNSRNIVASIDFHAFGEMIMYPWAYTYQRVDPSSEAFFKQLTSLMAQVNRYVFGQISEVIYVAPGSSADYYFWKHKSVSLGIEIGQSKVPSPTEFYRYFDSQLESTWRFLEAF